MKASLETSWIEQAVSRLASGSKRALARAIGIDNSGLLKTLNGERRLHIHEIAPLAEFLGISRYEVLDRLLGIPAEAARPEAPKPIDSEVLEGLIAHALQKNTELGENWSSQRLALMIVSAYRLWVEEQRASGEAPSARQVFDQIVPAARSR